MMVSTIVGRATANGISALNVIRVSGKDAILIVNQVFQGKNLEKARDHTLHYGHIVDQGTIIDEVMISLFREPNSFTRENAIEITCHGGDFVTSEIVRVLLKNGARLAEKGEFTRRAYLNGRIDLTEAEGIMDVIHAKTSSQLALAQKTLRGDIYNLVNRLQQSLLTIIAQIEVNIDYPEYDDAIQMTNQILIPEINALEERITSLIQASQTGRIIREGIQAVIVGKPNVGKSSLLNSLLKEEKAIVTEISGTTRDLIEAELNLDGILLKLVDTAGIRDTSDTVEKIGIDRAKKAIARADLVLLVMDQSASLTELDLELLELTKTKKRILVGNKIDLGKNVDIQSENIINISAKNNIGIDELSAEVKKLFIDDAIASNNEAPFSNARHIANLETAKSALNDALASAQAMLPVDMVEIDLRLAWSVLGEITGETSNESLVTMLFSKFCLGK